MIYDQSIYETIQIDKKLLLGTWDKTISKTKIKGCSVLIEKWYSESNTKVPVKGVLEKGDVKNRITIK